MNFETWFSNIRKIATETTTLEAQIRSELQHFEEIKTTSGWPNLSADRATDLTNSLEKIEKIKADISANREKYLKAKESAAKALQLIGPEARVIHNYASLNPGMSQPVTVKLDGDSCAITGITLPADWETHSSEHANLATYK